MFQESLLCVLAFCLALIPLGISRYRVKAPRTAAATWTIALLWLIAPATLLWAAIRHREPVVQPEPVSYQPIEVDKDGYVGSESCRHCHPHQHTTWHSSYHRTMTQLATPETVIGDFDDVELTWHGETVRLEREGDQFWAEMDEPLWKDKQTPAPRVRVPIVMTTGSHHYQVYWYSTGHARVLGNMMFVYLADDKKWIPRIAAFINPPEASNNHELARWNYSCSACHTTHAQPRGLGESVNDLDRVDTHVAEFGISCEACHGPGETHVRMNRDVARRYRLHFSDVADPTIVQPQRLTHQRSSQVCGQCHGLFVLRNKADVKERYVSGLRFRPGQDLADAVQVVRYHEADKHPMIREAIEEQPTYLPNKFWSDGMVRISGREYNGLLETPCFQHGEMSCLSCHEMHPPTDDPRPLSEWADDQLALGMRSNRACTQCHEEYQQEEKLAAHSHHAVSSTGSLCYNCHMPHTTYGLLKAIRSHQVDKPSISATLETGRPNACNQCHLDKTLAWTAEHLDHWYDIPQPEMGDDERNVAGSILQLLKGDAGQRALAAWNLSWEPALEVSGDHWMAPYLSQLLVDPYHAVRLVAYRSLRKLPGFEDFDYDSLSPEDNRMEAAIGQWNRVTRPEDRPTRPELLFDSSGQLNLQTYDRLYRQRNDRPMSLDE